MCADERYCSPNVFYRLVPPLRTLKVTLSFPAKDTWAGKRADHNNACTCASMVLFTDMLQHLQMLFIYTKRLKVSMICGSQNMNSIMRYDITFGFGSLYITVLSNYRLFVQPQTSVPYRRTINGENNNIYFIIN